jgi:hypothetical protein
LIGGEKKVLLDPQQLQNIFPNLMINQYQNSSDPTPTYNCIAWAAGLDDRWWEPLKEEGYYWPPDISWDFTVETLVRVYETLGYCSCTDSSLEEGYEKVAIYGKGEEATHVARQLVDGRWTSKLGQCQDIEHLSLESLNGDSYGQVVRFLKKPITPK